MPSTNPMAGPRISFFALAVRLDVRGELLELAEPAVGIRLRARLGGRDAGHDELGVALVPWKTRSAASRPSDESTAHQSEYSNSYPSSELRHGVPARMPTGPGAAGGVLPVAGSGAAGVDGADLGGWRRTAAIRAGLAVRRRFGRLDEQRDCGRGDQDRRQRDREHDDDRATAEARAGVSGRDARAGRGRRSGGRASPPGHADRRGRSWSRLLAVFGQGMERDPAFAAERVAPGPVAAVGAHDLTALLDLEGLLEKAEMEHAPQPQRAPPPRAPAARRR